MVTTVRPSRRRPRGFTLIEMTVVVALIGLLLTLAVPRYFASIERGKHSVQQQNLATIRDAIDKFYGDHSRYPETVEELVTRHYLRTMPVDPVTGKSDWVVLPPPEHAALVVPDSTLAAPSADALSLGAVYDVRSNAAKPAAATP